jgi:ribonuclease T1
MMLIAALVAVAITTVWKNSEKRRPESARQPPSIERPAPRQSAPIEQPRNAQAPPAAPRSAERTERPVANEPMGDRLAAVVRSADERDALEATLALIERGGPFPYPGKDGATFGNREGRLPARPRGYYREYTVPTRNASNRGARRVVTGSGGERWYTRDHYETFTRLDGPLD